MGQQLVELEGQGFGFQVNDAGVIDATSFFHSAAYAASNPDAWLLPAPYDVRAIILHHTAGWYGEQLDATAGADAEFAQIVACARDHAARFGIGPGYNMFAFPSGRLWAVGKHGTSRAHTLGREPSSRERWNVTGRALCAFGNYETEPVGARLASAIVRGIAEMRTWPGVRPGAPVHEHGLTPTVDTAGVMFSQATSCPGRNLAAWRAAGGLDGDMQPDRWGEGYAAGYRAGGGAGLAAAVTLYDEGHQRATRGATVLLADPPGPLHVPSTPPLGIAS